MVRRRYDNRGLIQEEPDQLPRIMDPRFQLADDYCPWLAE